MGEPIVYSIAGLPVYPHIKITREKYPRPLATRIIDDDGAEYFGAFLNRTAVRILIDFLNRTFRMRNCMIEIDGSFPVPCTQYYEKRCVGPCVESLCDITRYYEITDVERLFLANDRERFTAALQERIESAAEELAFERAAFWRDAFERVKSFWSKPKWQVWLDDTVDTFELVEANGGLSVFIVSQRGRHTLGRMLYEFEKVPDVPAEQALADVIGQFYRFHAPREIRVSHHFEGRRQAAADLGTRFGRDVPVSVISNSTRRATTDRALGRSKDEAALKVLARPKSAEEVQDEIAQFFELPRVPKRIEGFDAAHISATGFAAAVSVWEGGKFVHEKYEHWLSDRGGELETLKAFLIKRFEEDGKPLPDLILIDGGRSHLNAAVRGVAGEDVTVVSAVKPRGRHSEISHFLTQDGRRIEFDSSSAGMRLLRMLRDDAHALANAAHRQNRDMAHFYALSGVLPSLNEADRQKLLAEYGSVKKITALGPADFLKALGDEEKALATVRDIEAYHAGDHTQGVPVILPIRYDAPDGEAADLIPILTR